MPAVVLGVGMAPFATPRTSAPYDELAETALRAALADAGARATFFIQGRWAEAFPELARSIADAETSTPRTLPPTAARAASRVVLPVPHPMSRTRAPGPMSYARRSLSLCRRSSAS